MDQQRCPNCSANMVLVPNTDGTKSYYCEYCNTSIAIQPKTISDKVFAFANRIAWALSDDNPNNNGEALMQQAGTAMSRKEAYKKIQEERKEAYKKLQEIRKNASKRR